MGSIYMHDVQNFDTVKWSRAGLGIGVDDGTKNLAPTSYVRPATRNMVGWEGAWTGLVWLRIRTGGRHF